MNASNAARSSVSMAMTSELGSVTGTIAAAVGCGCAAPTAGAARRAPPPVGLSPGVDAAVEAQHLAREIAVAQHRHGQVRDFVWAAIPADRNGDRGRAIRCSRQHAGL